MPELSYHFGLRWDHVETMPAYELDAYIDALREIRREINQMNGGR